MRKIKDKVVDKALACFDKQDDESFWKSVKHFEPHEFDSPDLEGSGRYMDRKFVRLLDKARGLAGRPFVISSGARTPEHNEEVGGVRGSAHIIRCSTEGDDKGGHRITEVRERPEAADVKVNGSRDRFIVVDAAIKAGFTRIGVAEGFVHLDSDPNKDPEVIWLY